MDEFNDEFSINFPLIYKHSRNFAAKMIQKSWKRYMSRIVYKYLLDCSHEFEQNLNARELSRIYPEFLESSDSKMMSKLQIKMQGESFPPCLVCRIISDHAPSIDGRKHSPKWIPLFHSGTTLPLDQKALVRLFLEAQHINKENKFSRNSSKLK